MTQNLQVILRSDSRIHHRYVCIFFTILIFAIHLDGQVSRYVDPFLGVEGGGDIFPGASMPFGMIKPGPDMDSGENDWNAGWNPSGPIRGFSQTHVSGTGGGAKYGNILVQPTIGDPNPIHSESPRDREEAAIGLYRVTLTRFPINVEVTTARRTALYRFEYPKSSKANLLFDVSHCLASYARAGEGQSVTSSEASVLSPTEVTGFSSVTGGWNKQPNSYTVYFYASTDTAATSWGTWNGENLQSGSKNTRGSSRVKNGAWLTFNTANQTTISLKLGISFISVEQAKKNVISEIDGYDFNKAHSAATAAWDRALSTIEIKNTSPKEAQQFYTAVYHTMLMPVDRTGENPLWKSDEPYYDDYFAIWDTFRSSSPLLTLIAPQRQTDIVKALVDLFRHERWLPDARSGNYNGRTQGGSNAEFVLTDAYLKGLKGIDWQTAFAAEKQDAEISPTDQIKEGRGGLDDWHKLGYVSLEGVDRPGSKQVEYAANDFEIAMLAKGLGKQDDYKKYLKSSGNWKNLWDPDFSEDGFSGFIRPRHTDGSWLKPFTALDECSWGGQTFYEANSWTYSTFVPQDVAGLIQKSGGVNTFVERLDAFFGKPGRYDVGNEPGFLSPYLYIWAGRHDKTAEQLRHIIETNYHTGRNGLPGNDDSGAMSSWFVFGQIGIYPNAGQDVYLIGSPAIQKTAIHLSADKQFSIKAENLSPTNIYITAAELNGKPLDRAWFRHGEIANGGSLVLTMSAKPSSWPTGDPPPSYSSSTAEHLH